MVELEKGEDKIQKICDYIRKETLDPAKQQAKEIVENAHIEAEQIIKRANREKEKIVQDAQKEINRERKVFESSINIATRQALDYLKQKIEGELFVKNLEDVVIKATKEPKVIADLINAIIKAIEKQAIDVDISAYVPSDADIKAINEQLLKEVFEKLKERELIVGDFKGGVKIKLHDMQLTIDITNETLKDLLSNFIRSEFRKLIFSD